MLDRLAKVGEAIRSIGLFFIVCFGIVWNCVLVLLGRRNREVEESSDDPQELIELVTLASNNIPDRQ